MNALATIYFLFANTLNAPPLIIPNLSENECEEIRFLLPVTPKNVNGIMLPGTYTNATCIMVLDDKK